MLGPLTPALVPATAAVQLSFLLPGQAAGADPYWAVLGENVTYVRTRDGGWSREPVTPTSSDTRLGGPRQDLSQIVK